MILRPQRVRGLAALCRESSPAFAGWARGYGVIEHSDLTCVHLTYARHVHLDGSPLEAGDFKPCPKGIPAARSIGSRPMSDTW